jgi:hypothetical protein
MAILNIVAGSLFILSYVCCGIFLLLVFNNQSILAVAGVNIVADQWEFMARDLPSYPAVRIASPVLWLTLSTTLLACGIGLLNMRGWARVTAIVYCITASVADIAWVGYTVALTIPAKRRWLEDLHRRLNLPPGSRVGGIDDEAIGIFVAVAEVAYAVILLIMMLLPHVAGAFARRGPYDDYGPERYGRDGPDYDDWDNGSRRRPHNSWDY